MWHLIFFRYTCFHFAGTISIKISQITPKMDIYKKFSYFSFHLITQEKKSVFQKQNCFHVLCKRKEKLQYLLDFFFSSGLGREIQKKRIFFKVLIVIFLNIFFAHQLNVWNVLNNIEEEKIVLNALVLPKGKPPIKMFHL